MTRCVIRDVAPLKTKYSTITKRRVIEKFEVVIVKLADKVKIPNIRDDFHLEICQKLIFFFLFQSKKLQEITSCYIFRHEIWLQIFSIKGVKCSSLNLLAHTL